MTYGAEAWTLTKRQENKLAGAQRSMEKIVLTITKQEKIRNVAMRERTRVNCIIEQIVSLKGQWAGYNAQMDNTKWAKITTEWTPEMKKGEEADPNEDGEMA